MQRKPGMHPTLTNPASVVARPQCDHGDFGIGQPVPRAEDPHLVRGTGRYVDDVKLIGEARAYVLLAEKP
jgi:hypothetical protein